MFQDFGSLFLRRCGALRAGCRGSGRLWSIYLFWTLAYFLIVCLVHYFFAVRTCYRLRPPRSGKKPHWTVQTETVRPRATQSIQTDAFILAKSHTFLRKQAQPMVHNQKAETTLRRSRGNLASCPGFGVFVWRRGLFRLVFRPALRPLLFPSRVLLCCVLGCGVRPVRARFLRCWVPVGSCFSGVLTQHAVLSTMAELEVLAVSRLNFTGAVTKLTEVNMHKVALISQHAVLQVWLYFCFLAWWYCTTLMQPLSW